MKRVMMRLVLTALVVGLLITAGCSRSDQGQATTEQCSLCHNETTVILAKRIQWERSKHGSGEAYLRGTSSSCAGCHSSEGFVAMLDAGKNFSEVKEGVTNPTGPNCRTCHEIHITYTEQDWKRRTEQPVDFVASGRTYNAGAGNLCANCHQPRAALPASVSGNITVDSIRWGPHHGVQGTSFLGIGGYGVDNRPSVHYSTNIRDGCVVCHMVNGLHDMVPNVSACQSCHPGLTNFDYQGTQKEIKGMIDELKGLLEVKGMLRVDLPIPGTYPEAHAGALWNYLAVIEDGSSGVHNPEYIKSLLRVSIEAVK